MNAAHDTQRHAGFIEATRHLGANSWSVRGELLQVERDLLVADRVPGPGAGPEARDALGALTFGMDHDIITRRNFEAALGGNVTFYAVPASLQPSHGQHPVSFQLFVRVRPPAGSMGRMWNMRMGKTMQH